MCVVAEDNGEREVGGGLSGCGGRQRGREVWGLHGGWGSYGAGEVLGPEWFCMQLVGREV